MLKILFFMSFFVFPPQDYEDFFQSKENNTVFAFLGLSSKPSVKVRESVQAFFLAV